MHIECPDTDQFKEFKKLVTENTMDKKNFAIEKFLVEEVVDKDNDIFSTDEYRNWVDYHLKYLKYIYCEDLFKHDWLGMLPLCIYCMKLYVVYIHNKKMEGFENIKDEIEGLVKP